MIKKHDSILIVSATSMLAGTVIGLTIAQFLVVDEQLSQIICWITFGVFLIDLVICFVHLWRITHDN